MLHLDHLTLGLVSYMSKWPLNSKFILKNFFFKNLTNSFLYSNAETHLVLIQCRHGPHRLVASSLPFLTKINDEKVLPRLIYTGATLKNCYKVSEICTCTRTVYNLSS